MPLPYYVRPRQEEHGEVYIGQMLAGIHIPKSYSYTLRYLISIIFWHLMASQHQGVVCEDHQELPPYPPAKYSSSGKTNNKGEGQKLK